MGLTSNKAICLFLFLLISNNIFAQNIEKGIKKADMKLGYSHTSELCGGLNEYQKANYSDNIKSNEITSFEYKGSYDDISFSVKCELDNKGKLCVKANGGDYYARNNSAFRLNYTVSDNELLIKLNEQIKNHKMSNDNGHSIHVNGLPEGLGDSLSVVFKSGEKIYKSSNQSKTISNDASKAIYDLFHNFSIKHGYDFTTDKSTEVIYDDADEQYVQGTWTGKHFGNECKIVFEGKHVRIYYAGQLTDDTDYVIINGIVLPDKLREKPIGNKEEHKYEYFNGITSLSKKNKFTMSVYVYRDKASSNFDVMKFKK